MKYPSPVTYEIHERAGGFRRFRVVSSWWMTDRHQVRNVKGHFRTREKAQKWIDKHSWKFVK